MTTQLGACTGWKPKRNLAQGRAKRRGAAPWVRCIRMVRALQGQEETFEMYFRMKPPMFPAATLPFPSAGDVLPRCLSLRPATFGSGRRVCGWAGYPGCRSFHSLCPGLGSSCPFGAYMSKCISVRSLFTTTKTTRTTQLGSACPTAYMSSAW